MRQCKVRRVPVDKANPEPALHRQLMMTVLQNEIKDFQNISLKSDHKREMSNFDLSFFANADRNKTHRKMNDIGNLDLNRAS